MVDAGTFTDQLAFTVSGTGSYYTEAPADAGTNEHSLSVTAFGSIFYVIVTGYDGTDRMSLAASAGNISTYDLYNFVNNGNLAVAAYGTHFESIVPGGNVGTNSTGMMSWAAFGSHTAVTIYLAAGTDQGGTLNWSAFGTLNLVVYSANAGTDSFGTNSFSAWGTAEFVVPSSGTYSDSKVTCGFAAFGTYAST